MAASRFSAGQNPARQTLLARRPSTSLTHLSSLLASVSDDDLCTNFVVNYEGDNEQPTLNELGLDLVSPTNDDPSRSSLLSPLPKIRKERTWSLSKNLTSSKNENILRTKQRTIYIAGRPPWYDAHGQLLEPLLIGSVAFCNSIYFRTGLIRSSFARHLWRQR